MIFFSELHLDSIDRDIEGELAKSPKMVSNVQQLMFIGKFLFTLFLIFLHSDTASLTINVPVVYMARDVMILMRATSITRVHWKGTPTKRPISKRPVSQRLKRQVYKTSGLQNVRFTKRQVFKTSGCKKYPYIFCTCGWWKSADSIAAMLAGKLMAVFYFLF